MLVVENISVYYGRVRALRDVSLNVAPGELVTIIGANGAGKTSLLNAIGGVVPVAGGRIVWKGTDLSGLPAHRIARMGIAYVPEGRQLFGSMSVRDNLILGSFVHCIGDWRLLIGYIGGLLRREPMHSNLERVFALFPILRERQQQKAGCLSGGEQQMLAIGRALMASPQILLLDEPSVGLAPTVVRQILALLARLKEQGLTILLVEQDAVAALRVADRGYIMERGRIVAAGTTRELLMSEKLSQAYLGRARK